MILTIHLPDDLGRRLQERASHDGQAVEEYLLHLIERDVVGAEPPDSIDATESAASPPRAGGAATLSDREFQVLLDELASGPVLPRLPTHLTRADIYADHD